MKKGWFPWILLIAVFCSAQFWGSHWKRDSTGLLVPSAEVSVPGALIPLDCPIDVTGLRFGAICKNTTTGNVCIRDASGLFNVRGGGPC